MEIAILNIGSVELTKRFEEINKQLTEKIKNFDNVVVTDTKGSKKDIAEFRKLKDQFENERKLIKNEINKPYLEFEVIYKEKISQPLEQVIQYLDNQVKEIESNKKQEIENELKEYFNSVNKHKFLSFENVNIKIGLTTKISVEKANIDNFIARIDNDILAITGLDNSKDVLFEYTKTLDFSLSVQYANEKKAFEKEAKVEKVEVEVDQEELLELSFTLIGTRTQLKKVKEFILNENIEIKGV